MLPTPNSYTTLCILFTSFWGLCYGFVLLSTAQGANGLPQENSFKPGSGWLYDFRTSVLLNEMGQTSKDVGFLITGNVLVESIWGNSNLERLLKFELISPQLHIRSRKAPAPDGFVTHTSKLDSTAGAQFLVEWNKGKIEKILLPKGEPTSIANLKKGIASLFQFQLLDQQTVETDSSGKCNVEYISDSSSTFRKTKSGCASQDLPFVKNPEIILSARVNSERIGDYKLDTDKTHIQSVHFSEVHTMLLEANQDIGNQIETQQLLMLTNLQSAKEVLQSNSLEGAAEEFSKKTGIILTQESLQTERETLPPEEAITFSKIVKEYRDNLKNKVIGSLTSAKVVPKIISIGRVSSKADISKALDMKKNQAIMHQIVDILGYIQTEASHEAAMKKLPFDDPNKSDLIERYMWALSMSSQPNPDVINDLLNRYTKTSSISNKLKETIVSTLAAMITKLSKLDNYDQKIYNNVEEALLHGLGSAKGEHRLIYLRSLTNLKSKNIVPKLLKITKSSKSKEQVLAWKALSLLDKTYWDQNVLKAALATFFELHQKQDSSSRTFAVDIILESNPSNKTLKELLYILLGDPKAYEIQQYLVQRLKMLGERDASLEKRINKIIKQDRKLNNYAVLALKGLSTALTRSFLENPSSNGSLITIQEMQSGIVKRGTVDVVMSKNGVLLDIFSLGIFSAGLSSFVSSDSESTNSDDPATAGIELSVLGTHIRPFVFFNGQSELMGHVWSGTASERTTAYQALAMLHDHLENLRLGPGLIAELDLKGATSFDLAGKVEFSLWNRNAVALVEKSAGIALLGVMRVDTSFVRSQVEFSVSIEPKLNLNTDLDFYSSVSLCMRLSQPDLVFRHNIFKIERIPGSKHRLRKVKYKKYLIPGKTYSLNKKNNEMCNVIFSK